MWIWWILMMIGRGMFWGFRYCLYYLSLTTTKYIFFNSISTFFLHQQPFPVYSAPSHGWLWDIKCVLAASCPSCLRHTKDGHVIYLLALLAVSQSVSLSVLFGLNDVAVFICISEISYSPGAMFVKAEGVILLPHLSSVTNILIIFTTSSVIFERNVHQLLKRDIIQSINANLHQASVKWNITVLPFFVTHWRENEKMRINSVVLIDIRRNKGCHIEFVLQLYLFLLFVEESPYITEDI